MISAIQPTNSTSEFSDVLDSLQSLTREFLLGFRLQVGKLLLDRFYKGNLADYRSKDPEKDNSFTQFSLDCAESLAELGLSVNVLRQCINARATYDTLPYDVREKLQFTQVVELARVADPTQRARLAMDATQQHWNVGQLKQAITKVSAGHYYDTDPTKPGTQPPPDPAHEESETKARKHGHVLVEFERTVKELASLRADWLAADVALLKTFHRERATAVLEGLKAQVAALEKVLGAPAK